MDLSRSIALFDPNTLKKDVHIIGLGATGSAVFMLCLKHGIYGENIHLYDPDTIESKNIGNQIYEPSHIGMYKVDAAAQMALERYGRKVNVYRKKVTSVDAKVMKGIVFLLVDRDREEIFNGLRYNINVELLIETGLDSRAGIVNSINPMDPSHVRWFEHTRIDNLQAGDTTEITTACGGKQVVKCTVDIIAGCAFWRMIGFHNDPSDIGTSHFISCVPFHILERETKL